MPSEDVVVNRLDTLEIAVKDIANDMRDVRHAIRGDAYGNTGFVKKIDDLKTDFRAHIADDVRQFDSIRTRLSYAAGAIFGVVIVIKAFEMLSA